MTRKETDRLYDEHRRVLGPRGVHRHAGAALLERHVRAARLRGRRARRPRDPHGRRGHRRRRRRVPAPLLRALLQAAPEGHHDRDRHPRPGRREEHVRRGRLARPRVAAGGRCRSRDRHACTSTRSTRPRPTVTSGPATPRPSHDTTGTDIVAIDGVQVLGADGQPMQLLSSHDAVVLQVDYTMKRPVEGSRLRFSVATEQGLVVAASNEDQACVLPATVGKGEVRFAVPSIPFGPGRLPGLGRRPRRRRPRGVRPGRPGGAASRALRRRRGERPRAARGRLGAAHATLEQPL